MPTTWEGWAVRVSAFVREGKKLLREPRFPIRIADVAQHYSLGIFPNEPITTVEGEDFGGKWEGALVPRNHRSEWAIFYDRGHASKGRINFTIAHEFGHYLAHRHLSGDPFFCSRRDLHAWDSAYGRMEAEANQFAARVLMPPDDFREMTKSFSAPTLSQFEVLRDRYEVSLTAAVLNWLKSTRCRAMIVVSKDGFIDWSWSSPPLLSTGVTFRARQETIPVPDGSLAAQGASSGQIEARHPLGVWSAHEAVFESVVFAEAHEMTISLLIYPLHGRPHWERPALVEA